MQIPTHPIDRIDAAIHELQHTKEDMLKNPDVVKHYQTIQAVRSFVKKGQFVETVITPREEDVENSLAQVYLTEDKENDVQLMVDKVHPDVDDVLLGALLLLLNKENMVLDVVHHIFLSMPVDAVDRSQSKVDDDQVVDIDGNLKLVINNKNERIPGRVLATIKDGHLDLEIDKDILSQKVIPAIWAIVSPHLEKLDAGKDDTVVLFACKERVEDLQNSFKAYVTNFSTWTNRLALCQEEVDSNLGTVLVTVGDNIDNIDISMTGVKEVSIRFEVKSTDIISEAIAFAEEMNVPNSSVIVERVDEEIQTAFNKLGDFVRLIENK